MRGVLLCETVATLCVLVGCATPQLAPFEALEAPVASGRVDAILDHYNEDLPTRSDLRWGSDVTFSQWQPLPVVHRFIPRCGFRGFGDRETGHYRGVRLSLDNSGDLVLTDLYNTFLRERETRVSVYRIEKSSVTCRQDNPWRHLYRCR